MLAPNPRIRAVSEDKRIYRDEQGSAQLLFRADMPSSGKPVSNNVVIKKSIYLATGIY
jgi:hypothetical protein